jgi:hypothetical protein
LVSLVLQRKMQSKGPFANSLFYIKNLLKKII